MKKAFFVPLILKLSKIYFSNIYNKDSLYKKEIYYTLKDMGGVYIKFLQILCVTKNFMAGWSTPKEFEVYNKVPKEEINLFDWIPCKEEYDYIERIPIAAGSFAQVYKGHLKSGEVVALKVLRPSVYNNLKKDLKKLKKIVKIFSNFISIDLLDLNAAFKEFSDMCVIETDYEREICNLDYFYKMYEDNQFIKIPKVYHNLSNKYLIVQEFIDGVTLADVITDLKVGEDLESKCFQLTGSNIWKQLIIIGGELLRCAMEEDFLYGDPHSGNIILLPNNKVAFIDFGIVSKAPISHQAFYSWVKSYYDILNGNLKIDNFIESTCNCFCPDYINALKKCTNYTFVNALSSSMNNKLTKMKEINPNVMDLIKNGHIFILFTEFIDQKNFLNISLDLRNFSLLKACQAYICTIYTIDKRFLSNNFSFLMLGAIEYALQSVKNVTYDYSDKSKYSISEAFELLDSVLASVANNDELLFDIFKEIF